MRFPLSYRQMLYVLVGGLIFVLFGTHQHTLASSLSQSSTPTATNTPGTVPSFTPTDATQPATATATATETPTSTAIPATETPTSTAIPATATNTPIPHRPNPAPDTPTPTKTMRPTNTPEPFPAPDSLEQLFARVFNYPARFEEAYPPPLTDFDPANYLAETDGVTITLASGEMNTQLMRNSNTGEIVIATALDAQTNTYPINRNSPIYKAVRFLGLLPVSPEVVVSFEERTFHAIQVLDPETGELAYLFAQTTTAEDGSVRYGIVFKSAAVNP